MGSPQLPDMLKELEELSELCEDWDFSDFPERENDVGALLAPPQDGPPRLPQDPLLRDIEVLSDFFLLWDDSDSLLLENDSEALLLALPFSEPGLGEGGADILLLLLLLELLGLVFSLVFQSGGLSTPEPRLETLPALAKSSRGS